MIVVVLFVLAAVIVTAMALEPGRAERRQQHEADEAAADRDYWRQVKA